MLRWTVRLDGGPRRVNHAAVAIGDKIYSFGGYCTGEDYDTTRPIDVHVLDTITYRWSIVQVCLDDLWQRRMPYQRYGHTCVAWDDKAFVWGGRNDQDGACNFLFQFDPSTKEWSRPAVSGGLPGARDGHSACVLKDAMYIFGGYEEELDRFSNEIHEFNFLTNIWTLIEVTGHPASWRDFHSASPLRDRYMVVFGGRSDYGAPFHTNHEFYCKKVHIFDTTTRRWRQAIVEGEGPQGRRSHSAFVHKDVIHFFGGYNGNEDRHFADLWELRMKPDSSLSPDFTWKKLYPRGGFPAKMLTPTRLGNHISNHVGNHVDHLDNDNEDDADQDMVEQFNEAIIGQAVNQVADPGNLVPNPPGDDGLPVQADNQEVPQQPSNPVAPPLHQPANPVAPPLHQPANPVAPPLHQPAIQLPSSVIRAPCARRRQCCCVVKDTVILFGGTSPAPQHVQEPEFNLMDHSDLYVLDFYPSLKTLCLIAVVDNHLDESLLPRELQWELISMTTNSNISRPLTNG